MTDSAMDVAGNMQNEHPVVPESKKVLKKQNNGDTPTGIGTKVK